MKNEKRNLLRPVINKKYKQWQTTQLLSFRKALTINNVPYRILLIKVKNQYYIEFHLGKHKYYDKIRNLLGLTKKNYLLT